MNLISQFPYTLLLWIKHGHRLNLKVTEELMAEVSRVLKGSSPPKSIISKEELIDLTELRSDRFHVFITADKGVAMVVLNKKDYTMNKVKNLLEQLNTYRNITIIPNKNRLTGLLKSIKAEERLGTAHIKGCIQKDQTTTFYGLPKIHKRTVTQEIQGNFSHFSNLVNITYLTFWDIAQARYIPGIQSRHGTSLEPKIMSEWPPLSIGYLIRSYWHN